MQSNFDPSILLCEEEIVAPLFGNEAGTIALVDEKSTMVAKKLVSSAANSYSESKFQNSIHFSFLFPPRVTKNLSGNPNYLENVSNSPPVSGRADNSSHYALESSIESNFVIQPYYNGNSLAETAPLPKKPSHSFLGLGLSNKPTPK